jgi:transposase
MECFVAIDVSKVTLDVVTLPDAETQVVTNDDADHADLVPRLAALHPTLVMLETTGGFESAAVAAPAKRKLPGVVVNPRQVRNVATSIGRLAQTDALDGGSLARFGKPVRLAVRLAVRLPQLRARAGEPAPASLLATGGRPAAASPETVQAGGITPAAVELHDR